MEAPAKALPRNQGITHQPTRIHLPAMMVVMVVVVWHDTACMYGVGMAGKVVDLVCPTSAICRR